MNRLLSNDLSIIVNIQYGIGFEFVEGKVEIETTIFDRTRKSRAVPASRNRINFYEEFIWKIDRTTLKQSRTTNDIVKVECFTTPDIFYGHVYRRQRIGHVIIKLKEFQIIGRDWDQNVLVRGYKLKGSGSNCELRMVLIIQENIDISYSKKLKNVVGIENTKNHFNNGKKSLEYDKQGNKTLMHL